MGEFPFGLSGGTGFPLAAFEIPRWLVEPAVMACRAFNTAVDAAFYDVPELVRDLADKDMIVATMQGGAKMPSRIVNLDALTNPEGSLLLIDTTTAPYVHRFIDVQAYLDSPHPETKEVAIATVTGVGSSAYGAAAFGWQVSRALGKPVLAIVPGYGVADMIQQALGGWFVFGLHDFLEVKPAVQTALAEAAPDAAEIGRALPQTAPDHVQAPLFEHGSGSSDVLHALLSDPRMRLTTLVGHSKGALVIKNAIRSLTPVAGRTLTVATFGCPIAHEEAGVRYHQCLGLFDLLGELNAWGNPPDRAPAATHTTNPYAPAPLPVVLLLQQLLDDQAA